MSTFTSPAISGQVKTKPPASVMTKSGSTTTFSSPTVHQVTSDKAEPQATSSNQNMNTPNKYINPLSSSQDTQLSSSSGKIEGASSSMPTPTKRGPRGPRKTKKLKDPSAPKRAPSGFMLFCADERPKVTDENSALSMTEVAKELGRRWAFLDMERKAVWEEKSKVGKSEYAEAKKNYKPSNEFLQKKADHEQKIIQKSTSSHQTGWNLSLKRTSFDQEPNDLEDYFKFLAENWQRVAASQPGMSGLQVQTHLWEQWSNRQSSGKKAAKKQKKEAKHVSLASEGAKNMAETAFSVFCRHMKRAVELEMPSLTAVEVREALVAKWRAMGEEERNSFLE